MNDLSSISDLAASAKPDKYLIIRINHPGAGFFSYVNFVLNQLLYAEEARSDTGGAFRKTVG